MGAGAMLDGGYDARWHQRIEEQVEDHDEKLRGNGEKGLMERTATIEEYIAGQVKREEEEKKTREEREKEARSNRTLYKIAAFSGSLALLGLLVMSVFDHTVWKPAAAPVTPVVVQQTTTTDTTSTTTKIQKPVKP